MRKNISRAFLSFCIFSIPYFSHAALIYFDPMNSQVFRGDTQTVGVRLDTDEDECVNVVDVVVNYDPSLRAVDVSRGNSILSIWVEDPVIDEMAHTVTFTGGIPGGYCGRIPGDPMLTNVIAEIVFKSPGLSIGGGSTDQAKRIWIDPVSQVRLHDGFGTQASLRTEDAFIQLLSTPGSEQQDDWNETVIADNELPSEFAITLTSDDNAFSGKHFIVFNAVDKQSGIDHYEVMEEPLSELYTFSWGRADAPWVRAESPYVLTDQTLNSTIRVKAIDKAGNERISVLVPDDALRSMSKGRLVTLIAGVTIVALIGLLLWFAIWKYRKQTPIDDNVPTI